MNQENTKPNFEAELNAYAARRAARSADWNAHLHRWPVYAAATGAALAMTTSAEASSIVTGFSGTTINVEGDASFKFGNVTLGTLGDLELELFHTHSTNGLIYGEHGQGRLLGVNGAAVNATGSELRRFSSGKAITNGMARQSRGFAQEQVFYYLIGGNEILENSGFGQWSSGQAGFAGFKLANGDLGWIQLKWSSNQGGFPTSLEALAWAVETTPGVTINAGQTTVTSAPEPDTAGLALLAMGAAGVSALWKLRRAKA